MPADSPARGLTRRCASCGGSRWEKATQEDTLFVLDVPWLSTGMSLGQVAERIFRNANVPPFAYSQLETWPDGVPQGVWKAIEDHCLDTGTGGQVYVCAGAGAGLPLPDLERVALAEFAGRHPAGNGTPVR